VSVIELINREPSPRFEIVRELVSDWPACSVLKRTTAGSTEMFGPAVCSIESLPQALTAKARQSALRIPRVFLERVISAFQKFSSYKGLERHGGAMGGSRPVTLGERQLRVNLRYLRYFLAFRRHSCRFLKPETRELPGFNSN
jgi:hypothetical protein